MAIKILRNIINIFSPEEFIHFFRFKNSHFKPYNEPVHYYNDDNFKDCLFIGEIPFDSAQRLHIYSFRVTDSLTERSGKKKQYEKGKRILKETNTDAGIFIFYDDDGNFRFSLIYTEYSGARRRFSYFKRFTYFVSPRLTNKTFLKQIGEGDFSSLEKIKEAFSVEPVTKQFYEEIQNWYFWAMDKVKFPEDYKYSNDNDRDKEIRIATNLIRLITRIIFIWFIKEKGLIPEVLFDREKLKGIIRDFGNPQASNYYNAILQNLFFATLNQKMNERRFASEKGYPLNKSEYGVKTLYRYKDKFLVSEKEVLGLFKEIPFLNGGLFDCLDKEDEAGKVIYIDGFSRNPKKQALIPDYLFFQQDETRVDLSTYGLGSNKQVRGLIEILKSYNFTIDESTPVDQEVALDPELLGKVFENLLASYNPETATTARKATGSYYTPREIVDYMVDESLKEYFKIQLPGIDEEKIELLVSYAEESPEFSQEEKQRIISAIDRAKILDPACGSGAFPMGILHKLVYILQKIDPNNDLWYELQYQKALRASEEVFKEKDKSEREAMLKEINEAFDESINYPDYARKLYLIENCIYGIDIQPIAIQISKLRFFISLVLDQKIDRTKENFGIRALPNLETKFVAANTLIGLDVPRIDLFSENDQMNKLQEELKNLRHKYFTAKTRKQKLSLQSRDREIRTQMSNLLEKKLIDEIQKEIEQLKNRVKHEEDILLEIKQGPEEKEIIEINTLFGKENKIIDKKKEKIESQKIIIKELKKNLGKLINIEEQQIKEQARKIASFDLFDQNASADWFDPEWMFGVVDGFDIVIGNPPYGANYPSELKKYFIENYSTAKTIKGEQKGSLDTYTLFIEKGFNLLKPYGILIFIVPISITSSESVEGLHNLLERNCKIIKISSYAVRPQPIFQNSVVNTSIISFIKTLTPAEKILCTKMHRKSKDISISDILNNLEFIDVKEFKLKGRYPKISYQIEKDILQKIFDKNNIPMENLIRSQGKPIYYRTSGGRYFKIVTNYPTGSTKEKALYFDKDIADIIGAILSSNLFFWFYQIYSNNLDLKLYDISIFCIPYKKFLENPDLIKKIEKVYNEYLNDIEKNAIVKKTTRYKKIKKFKEYRIKKSKHIIDKIDDIICPLYGMTEKEIDFIKNYEIKFRLGDEDSGDEEENIEDTL
jgi:adenine-specific DNA-methyltransferase